MDLFPVSSESHVFTLVVMSPVHVQTRITITVAEHISTAMPQLSHS